MEPVTSAHVLMWSLWAPCRRKPTVIVLSPLSASITTEHQGQKDRRTLQRERSTGQKGNVQEVKAAALMVF